MRHGPSSSWRIRPAGADAVTGYSAPVQDMRFVLDELADMAGLARLPGYEEATPDLVASVLEEAGKLAAEVLAPLNHSGDREGVTVENGVVRTPAGSPEAYARFVGGGWGAPAFALPIGRHFAGSIGEDRPAIVVALGQPHTAASAQVDSRDYLHAVSRPYGAGVRAGSDALPYRDPTRTAPRSWRRTPRRETRPRYRPPKLTRRYRCRGRQSANRSARRSR